jgi:hypothetical protein
MKRFSPDEITKMRTWAALGYPGTVIAQRLNRTPESVRSRCSALGIVLRDLRKRCWHRLRILIEPTIHKTLTLAARKRGMRTGELCRRLLTAVVARDYFDVLLSQSDGHVPPLPPLHPRHEHRVEPKVQIPEPVLRERDSRYQLEAQRDLTATLMGDPPPRRPHSLGASAGEPPYITVNSLSQQYFAAYMQPTPRFVVQLH